MKENISHMLTKSKFDSKTLNLLVISLGNIYEILEQNKKLQLKSFEKDVNLKLKQFQEQLYELQLLCQKNQGLMSFVKHDKTIIDMQTSIKLQLNNLENLVKSKYKSINCDLDIITFNKQVFPVANYIKTQLLFTLNHPKYSPIEIIMEFLILESVKVHEYQMIIQHKYLIEKYFQTQENLKQKLSIENEKALFTLNYDKVENQLKFLIENDPYIITSSLNQSKIYLQEEMLLIFNNSCELKVITTNTKNINKKQLSSDNQNSQHMTQETIKINGFGYIKFQLVNLHMKNYEFYLKDSNIDLNSYFPGIDADLFNDSNGFYIIPKTNNYQLFYDKGLISKDEKLSVGIQLKNKFWINVEINKQKIDCFMFD